MAIPSGKRVLDGSFLRGHTDRAAVLIFHGIGDRLRYWNRAQIYLASYGVASLVFDYSGYGQSTGKTTPGNLLEDAFATYSWLQTRTGSDVPVHLLGFSLGTGLATEVAPLLHPEPAGLVLCQAYSSLRAATRRVVAPAAFLARLMPDHWLTVDAVAELQLPLLIVHGDADRLFPVTMPDEIFAAATRNGNPAVRLVTPVGHDHNAAYLRMEPEYWWPILDFFGIKVATTRAQSSKG